MRGFSFSVMINLTKLPPLSLYIHFPWCVQKCPYCDFNSHKVQQGVPENDYINALLKDLENDLPLVWGRKVNTIFMGGGTPSLFSPEAMDTLLSGIRARIPLSSNIEITMEANPGTIENKRLKGFREAGINRVSFGAQSFNDTHLQKLSRIHNAETAANAITMAKNADFENINLDLMFALPEQTLEQAASDIETAIALQPTHISYYQLTIEPNTAFHHQPPVVPGEDAAWEIFDFGKNKLALAGYQQYEVSAYAKNKNQCRHNANYWQFGDYLGIGAGAHAKISDGSKQSITRYWKHKHPQAYLDAVNESAISGYREVTNKELVFEFLMNALRLNEGFNLQTYLDHTGLKTDMLKQQLASSLKQELVDWNDQSQQIKTTEKGRAFLNHILEQCLPDSP